MMGNTQALASISLDEIRALLSKGAWQEARLGCEQFLNERPTVPEGYAYLGLAYFGEQEFAKALLNFNRATALNPSYWQAGAKAVSCLDRLGRFNEAYDLALEWQRVQPNDRGLNALAEGLKRYTTERITDAWQRSKSIPCHNIRFTSDRA